MAGLTEAKRNGISALLYYLPTFTYHEFQGFALANNMTGSIYEVIGKNPMRAERFANAMKVMTSRPEFDLSYATDYYDWGALGEAQVVDFGGGKGHFALALAKRYPRLRLVVQDMANVVGTADTGDMANRITFMPHGLFDPQTVCAEVYFFRWIFHNWSDPYCIRMLKAQVPKLNPGARLIIQEAFMPEAGTVARWKEKDLRYVVSLERSLIGMRRSNFSLMRVRSMDLEMAFTFNSRERTLADWKALFEEANPAFVLVNTIEPKGSAMGILEFVWHG